MLVQGWEATAVRQSRQWDSVSGARKPRSQPSQFRRGWRGGGTAADGVRNGGRRWQPVGEAVGQQGGGAVQGLVREAGGQGVPYGAGGDVALQPGRDPWDQVSRVRRGEQQPRVVAAQGGEEVRGRLEEGGGGAARLRYGGERLLDRTALRRRRSLRGRAPRVDRFAAARARLVAGDGAGDDSAGLRAVALAAQVAVGLQLAQGGGDTGGSLREAGGERLDVGARAGGQRLEVAAEADREERQLLVLDQVVADHHEAGGVAGVVVGDAAAVATRTGRIVSGG